MDILKNRKYLVFDGAMGTYYYKKTTDKIECELANLADEERIYDIHKEYINAGADAIKTNTFGANPIGLGEDVFARVIKKGWEIANRAVEGTEVLVFADIGPISHNDAIVKQTATQTVLDVFLNLSAKHFLFETFDEYDTVLHAAQYIKKSAPDSFILSSFAVDQDGYTKEGIYFIDIIKAIKASPYIDAYGFNCICGPAHMCNLFMQVEILEDLCLAMPNAGYSSNIGGRTFYNDNPEYFAQRISELANMGVKILGGCCGTTPMHIRLAKDRLKNQKETVVVQAAKPKAEYKKKTQNRIKEKILAKEKVIFAELDPPSNTDYDYLIKGSKRLKTAGVDAITVADSPLARARADSVMIAAKIKREVGIEAIPHLTCRDRNLIGFKSTFLGMYLEDIKNVLVVTGDPVPIADRNDIRGVYNLNSADLMKYIKRMNQEVFSGDELFFGGAINSNALNFDAELRKSEKKIENGAAFLMSQPVYSDRGVENLKTAKEKLGVPVLIGIMPLVGYKNAIFIKNEIPEIDIPDSIVNQFIDKDREESEDISVRISCDIYNKVKGFADGYYIMTPFKRVGLVLKVIDIIKGK